MTILILADDVDPTADAVVTALAERGAAVDRLNTAWFPSQLSVAAELRGGRWLGRLSTPSRTVSLEDVTAVWFWGPRAYRFPEAMSAAERFHANMEAKYGLGGVLTSLSALWVNHPSRLADAAYKPLQLVRAAECGLVVADTIITNEPQAARDFGGSGDTVTKMLGANTIKEEGTRKISYTWRPNAADLEDLRGFDQTTHMLQRWIPKDHEVRMVVIGDELTATAIYAHSPKSYVDFRADYPNLTYELVEPPAEVDAGVRKLMNRLDLKYGALDFVVSPDGTWTFLEINAGGQYGWIEHHTEAPLTAQLADLLIKGEQ